jgi:hypothetical protein
MLRSIIFSLSVLGLTLFGGSEGLALFSDALSTDPNDVGFYLYTNPR